MSKIKYLSQQEIKELIDYNPETGKLIWKFRELKWFKDTKLREAIWIFNNWNAKNAYKPALNSLSNGYLEGCLFGKRLKSHILIWFYMTGEWPSKGQQIDHKNRKRDDNRWINLRIVDNKENSKNRSLKSTNKSGITGVSYEKDTGLWYASIMIDGKTKALLRTKEKKKAIQARMEANKEYGFSN